MEVFRVTFDSSLRKEKEFDRTTVSLLIASDIKECLKGLYGVDINDNAILVPFKFPNAFEIYNLKTKKVDTIIKRFFSKGRTIEILNKEYTVENSEIKKFIWKERILKGYSNLRENKYKTINPIYLESLFHHEIASKNTIDAEEFKVIATDELKRRLAEKFGVTHDEVFLEWDEFDVTFSKCSLEDKNQVCFYGVFRANFIPPLFIGDYTGNGCGKVILLSSTKLETQKIYPITLNFSNELYKKVKYLADEEKISVLEYSKNCIEEKANDNTISLTEKEESK